MTRLSRLGIVDISSRDQRLENIAQHLRIGARGHGAFLRTAQFCGGDGLHRLGNLPRIDHAADSAPDVENVSHESVFSSQLSVFSFQSSASGVNWELRTSYFAAACLESTNCCFASFITLDISAFRLSSSTFFSMIVFSSAGF